MDSIPTLTEFVGASYRPTVKQWFDSRSDLQEEVRQALLLGAKKRKIFEYLTTYRDAPFKISAFLDHARGLV